MASLNGASKGESGPQKSTDGPLRVSEKERWPWTRRGDYTAVVAEHDALHGLLAVLEGKAADAAR